MALPEVNRLVLSYLIRFLQVWISLVWTSRAQVTSGTGNEKLHADDVTQQGSGQCLWLVASRFWIFARNYQSIRDTVELRHQCGICGSNLGRVFSAGRFARGRESSGTGLVIIWTLTISTDFLNSIISYGNLLCCVICSESEAVKIGNLLYQIPYEVLHNFSSALVTFIV